MRKKYTIKTPYAEVVRRQYPAAIHAAKVLLHKALAATGQLDTKAGHVAWDAFAATVMGESLRSFGVYTIHLPHGRFMQFETGEA